MVEPLNAILVDLVLQSHKLGHRLINHALHALVVEVGSCAHVMTVLAEVGIPVWVNGVLLDFHVVVGFALGSLGLGVLVGATEG